MLSHGSGFLRFRGLMTTGKAHVDEVNESEAVGVINTQAGDYIELKGLTVNHVRRRIEDFCKLNQIILSEYPSSWNRLKAVF